MKRMFFLAATACIFALTSATTASDHYLVSNEGHAPATQRALLALAMAHCRELLEAVPPVKDARANRPPCSAVARPKSARFDILDHTGQHDEHHRSEASRRRVFEYGRLRIRRPVHVRTVAFHVRRHRESIAALCLGVRQRR